MNCYNHQTIPAIAICKNCNKGLCPECLTEVENGVACTATCIDQVNLINEIINKNKNATDRAAGSYYRATFYFAMSLLFFYSCFMYPDIKTYGIAAGVIFLIGGLLTLKTARKYRKL